MDGPGGDKYIYLCICITAYSCWAVCSLGPTVLEAEGSALIGKGSLSLHSEAKVSEATAAPLPRSPHQLCRAECARFSGPPGPHGPARAAASALALKVPSSLSPAPCPAPDPGAAPRCAGHAVPQFPHSPRPALHDHITFLAPHSVAPSVIPAWCWPHRCWL